MVPLKSTLGNLGLSNEDAVKAIVEKAGPSTHRRENVRCDICKDSGFISVEREGYKVAQKCVCRTPQPTLLRLGVPAVNAGAKLDDFDKPFRDRAAKCLEREGMLIYGITGTGKTYYMAAMLRELVLGGRRVRFAMAGAIMRRLKASFEQPAEESEGQVIHDLSNCDVLAIDDLGKEGTITTFVVSSFLEIIGQRIDNSRLTLVTTNLNRIKDPQQPNMSIEEFYGAPLASRLGRLMETPFVGQDRRATAE